jgi:hypothetical protein
MFNSIIVSIIIAGIILYKTKTNFTFTFLAKIFEQKIL